MSTELWTLLQDMVSHDKAVSRRYVAVALREKFIQYAKLLQRRERALQLPEWWENSPQVELCELYGFSVAEIARLDGCSRQAFNRLKKDGIDKLKSLL